MTSLNTFANTIGVIHPSQIKIRRKYLRQNVVRFNVLFTAIEMKKTEPQEEKMTASSCMDRVYGVYVVLGELVCSQLIESR